MFLVLLSYTNVHQHNTTNGLKDKQTEIEIKDENKNKRTARKKIEKHKQYQCLTDNDQQLVCSAAS